MDVRHVIDVELKINYDPRVRRGLVFVSYFRSEMGKLTKLKRLHQSVKLSKLCGGLCEAAGMSVSTSEALLCQKMVDYPLRVGDELPLQGDLVFCCLVHP